MKTQQLKFGPDNKSRIRTKTQNQYFSPKKAYSCEYIVIDLTSKLE